MANKFYIEKEDAARLQEKFRQFPGDVEKAVNDVLHQIGGPLIIQNIKSYMPTSGRKPWRGKASSAKSSKSLSHINSNLAVEVNATKKYKYLYFPNDGSNTIHHHGGEWFMERGVEKSEEKIVDAICDRLEDAINV